jgi:hypothetical protein
VGVGFAGAGNPAAAAAAVAAACFFLPSTIESTIRHQRKQVRATKTAADTDPRVYNQRYVFTVIFTVRINRLATIRFTQ